MAELHAFRIQDPADGAGWHVSVARLTWSTVIASLVAAGATVGFYFFASAAGYVDRHVVLPSLVGMGPLTAGSVSATAALATLAAGVLFGVLAWSTRRPVRNFSVIATVLAVLSLSMPATIPGPALSMRLTMAWMHVIVWAVSLGVLARLAGRATRSAS